MSTTEEIITIGGKRYRITEVETEPEPPAELTYKEICDLTRPDWTVDNKGDTHNWTSYMMPGMYPTARSAKQAAARIKLEVVAAYLNGPDWEFPWSASGERCWCWYYGYASAGLELNDFNATRYGGVYFKHVRFASRARDILGDEVILHSLGVFKKGGESS